MVILFVSCCLLYSPYPAGLALILTSQTGGGGGGGGDE